jgi:hypothetical protein
MGEWIFLAAVAAVVSGGLFERRRRRRRAEALGPGHDAHRGPAEALTRQGNPADDRYPGGTGSNLGGS